MTQDLTHDIKLFRFGLIEPSEIQYVPGQYMQVLTPVYEKSKEEVYRAYSVASNPADNSKVELEIRLVPNGICTTYVHKYLTEGDEVIINFPDVEGLTLKAPIHRMGNVIDDKSRTFRIEMKVDNKTRKLKPNMYTTIRVNDFRTKSAFLVPSIAIKQDTRGSYIYVAKEDDGGPKARKRYITTGLSYNDQTMVREGVSNDEAVIVKGFSQVSDGVGVAIN